MNFYRLAIFLGASGKFYTLKSDVKMCIFFNYGATGWSHVNLVLSSDPVKRFYFFYLCE